MKSADSAQNDSFIPQKFGQSLSALWQVTKDKVERDRKDMNKRAIKTLVMAAAISSPLAIALPPIKTGPYASNPTLRAITAWV